jgi:phage terminase small subunit
MHKLTRKQIREGLDQVPITDILGSSVSRELTHKQKAFALELAKGNTKAGSYRAVYSKKAKPKTAGDAGSRLARDPRISAEAKALSLALEAQKHRTPEALRALVIQSLVSVLIDPEAKQATKVASAKVLGTVTEVSAFTERRETTIIRSSDNAKAELLKQIRTMFSGNVTDIEAIDPNELLAELATDSTNSEPHPAPTNPNQNGTPDLAKHTIPLEQSDDFSSLEDPPPHIENTTPYEK